MINIKITAKQFRTDVSIQLSRRRKNWSSGSLCKVLLLTNNNRVAESQIFPFYYYLKEFQNAWGVSFREIDIYESEINNKKHLSDADVILFQPWFGLDLKSIMELLCSIRESSPDARIIYIDSSAPADLRFAESTDPFIDLYMKKNIFSDRSLYGKPTQGDTNLVQFYEQLYDLPASPLVTFPVPQKFLSKLIIGPSFFTSSKMLPTFTSSRIPVAREKKLRVHARIMCKGSPWYQHMRENALTACSSFKANSVITDELIKYRIYYRELMQSKICFSPFGYGEVCWRDYEAIMAGALLVKPDMSHMETAPNIFIPHETYIPVRWDFSDLEEKLEYYLSHEKEANEIAFNAYRILHEYCNNGGFIQQMTPLFVKQEK